MSLYGLAGGVNKEGKEFYGLDGGVNRKTKEIYGLAGGVNKKVFASELFKASTIPSSYPNHYTISNCQGASNLSVTLKSSGTVGRDEVDEAGTGDAVSEGQLRLEIVLKDINSSATKQLFLTTISRTLEYYKKWNNTASYSNNGGYFNITIDSYDKNNYSEYKVSNVVYGNDTTFNVEFLNGYCRCNGVNASYPTGVTIMYPISCRWLTIDPYVNGSSQVTGSVTNLIVR